MSVFKIMNVIFQKNTFNIIFQKFKNCLFKRHFSFSKFLKSVYSRDTSFKFKNFENVSSKNTFGVKFIKMYLEKTHLESVF